MPEVLAATAAFTPAGCLPPSHQTPKPMAMVEKCLRRSLSRASRLPGQPASPAGFSPAPAPSSNRRWKQQSWPQTRARSIPGELRAAQEGRNQRFCSRAVFFLSPLLHFTPNHPQRGCQAPEHTAAGPAQLGNPLKAPKSSGKSPRGGPGEGARSPAEGSQPSPPKQAGPPRSPTCCAGLCCAGLCRLLPPFPASLQCRVPGRAPNPAGRSWRLRSAGPGAGSPSPTAPSAPPCAKQRPEALPQNGREPPDLLNTRHFAAL